MAINVNTVYQTVLSILNKEQRGYLTPDEFNKTATQVQLEIFENYFEDLNQQLRIPQVNTEYVDRQKNIDDYISIFKTIGPVTRIAQGAVVSIGLTSFGTGYTTSNGVATTGGTGSGLTLNIIATAGIIQSITISDAGEGYVAGDVIAISGGAGGVATVSFVNPNEYFRSPSNMHRIGTVIYKDMVELQRLERNEFLYVNKSPLTRPSTDFPIYVYENSLPGTNGSNTLMPGIYVYPRTVPYTDITLSYVRKPSDVLWGFNVGNLGQYVYSASASTQFELHPSEQTEVILRILAYAGIIIRDPQIIQAASQAVQAEEVNSKS
jgi:hypothetical protein